MQAKMKRMQDEIDILKKENMRLKMQSNKETQEEWGKDGWKERGWWEVDPWRNWKGKDDATKRNDEWVDEDGTREQKVEGDGKGDGGTRVWCGGRSNRRNEMVARCFERNTYWKEIKTKVEDVTGRSGVTYGEVKVIGQMASFAIIPFVTPENQRQFK